MKGGSAMSHLKAAIHSICARVPALVLAGGLAGCGTPVATTSPQPTPSPAPPCALGTPTHLGPATHTAGLDGGPSISANGLTLFFAADRLGALGAMDL